MIKKQFFLTFFFNQITPLISSVFNKNDTLEVILTKYKGKVNINYETPNKINALLLVCCTKDDNLNEGAKRLLKMPNLSFNSSLSLLKMAYKYHSYNLVCTLIDNPCVNVNITLDNYVNLDPRPDFFFQSIKNQKIAEHLMHRSDLKIIGDYEYSLIKIPQTLNHLDITDDFINRGIIPYYIKFFLNESGDEIVNQNKIKTIKENKIFFACLIAKCSEKTELEKFLEDYDVDINSVEEKTVFNFFFEKIMFQY